MERKDEGMKSHTWWSAWEVWSNWERLVCSLVAWFWLIFAKPLTNFHWKHCWFPGTLSGSCSGVRASVSCSCSWFLLCEPWQGLALLTSGQLAGGAADPLLPRNPEELAVFIPGIYMYVYVYVCIYICIDVYIYAHMSVCVFKPALLQQMCAM